MIDNQKVLAIIPARGGSKGLPRKNVLKLCGKPLVSYPINAALKSKYIDKVIVSTDDNEIAEESKKAGAEVPFIRPAELASDTSTSIDVVIHSIDFLEKRNEFYDYLVLLEPTSPLTTNEDIDCAISSLHSNRNIADSIVGMSKVEAAHPLFLAKTISSGVIAPYIRENFLKPIRRQELDDLYFFEGSLYISAIEKIKQIKSFVHDRTLPYIVPRWKSVEIDEFLDFIIVEAIIKNINKFTKGNENEK